jgi:predicted metal-binding membrane protein
VNGAVAEASLSEAVLRRDRWVLVAALIVVLAIAWGWLLAGAGMEMSAVRMTEMAGMDGWLMQPAQWSPAYAALIFAMWWVMMVAMMLPSAAPMLLLFARVNRADKTADAPLKPTLLFATGYLLAWGGFSAIATGLQWGLESARLMSPMLETTNAWLGAAILMAAGLWQLASFKAMCLRHCRTPLSYLVGHWRKGGLGALRMGLGHGAYCLGCCWILMALLFVGGVMNLYWIVGLAVFVLVEKTLPFGPWFGRATGIALIAWSLALGIQAL